MSHYVNMKSNDRVLSDPLTKNTPTYNSCLMNKNGAFCFYPSSLQGSMTIEASIMVPLVLGILSLLLLLFQVLRIEAGIEEALSFSARKVATSSYAGSLAPQLLAESEVIFHNAVRETVTQKKYIRNGWSGISLKDSSFDDQYVRLCASYRIKVPFIGIKGLSIPIRQTSCSKMWTGEQSDNGEYVYVTEHGSVYHKTSNCDSIKVSAKSVLFKDVEKERNASGEKYDRCHYCGKTKASEEWVYITKYGTAYHPNIQCQGLKKSLKRIPLRDVKERRRCMICWK